MAVLRGPSTACARSSSHSLHKHCIHPPRTPRPTHIRPHTHTPPFPHKPIHLLTRLTLTHKATLIITYKSVSDGATGYYTSNDTSVVLKCGATEVEPPTRPHSCTHPHPHPHPLTRLSPQTPTPIHPPIHPHALPLCLSLYRSVSDGATGVYTSNDTAVDLKCGATEAELPALPHVYPQTGTHPRTHTHLPTHPSLRSHISLTARPFAHPPLAICLSTGLTLTAPLACTRPTTLLLTSSAAPPRLSSPPSPPSTRSPMLLAAPSTRPRACNYSANRKIVGFLRGVVCTRKRESETESLGHMQHSDFTRLLTK